MGFWQLRMYTQESPIYIPECAPAVGATRSALTHFHELRRSCGTLLPFGFWCGGFSSTAGYVPGNEAQAFRLERLLLPPGGSSPKGATRFDPGAQGSQ